MQHPRIALLLLLCLVRAYPKELRARFGPEWESLFLRLYDERRRLGRAQSTILVLRTVVDALVCPHDCVRPSAGPHTWSRPPVTASGVGRDRGVRAPRNKLTPR